MALSSSGHCQMVGGQAVMDGVMMRNGPGYGLAVRLANGEIYARRFPWRSLTRASWLKKAFLRGFPVLLETLINGIQALNRSVIMSEAESDGPQPGFQHLAMSLALAILMAIALFVAAPHLLSLAMLPLGLGGDVEGLAFHLWDGFYKCAIFVAYIQLISLVPEIRQVFEYHGAEHKAIHAWESGPMVSPDCADTMSRLHPRCGTTFLLFVICISIIIQALLIPALLKIWSPIGMVAKHAFILAVKLALIIPISAVAYELIRYAAALPQGLAATLLRAPGLALQKLTTREPSKAQLEVAFVALAEALGPDDGGRDIATVPYTRLSDEGAPTAS